MKKAFLTCLLALTTIATAQETPRFSAPAEASANVFQSGQTPKFNLQAAGSTEAKVLWTLQDWQGKEIAHGDASLKTGGALSLAALPPGYYQLMGTVDEKPLAATPFAVVAPPRPLVDSPYGLDSAQTSILIGTRKMNPQQPKNGYEILARLIRLSGISMSRERLSWPGVSTASGDYNWTVPDEPINLLAKDGVPVLNMFTQAPLPTRGDLQSLPRDLLALYRFSQEAASHYQGKVVAWEFWNEPDDMYCLDSAWDFAAAQKVAYAGFHAGNPSAKILIGANANSPTPRFVELALQNGAGDFFDAYNFHTYASAGALPRIAAEKQGLLRKYGLSEKPIWITEIGLQNEGVGGASANIAGQKLREHDPAQELQQARFLVYGMLTGQAHGIERMFFFALPPYNEQDGGKVWGLLRWDWTVKPGYVALANLTAQLAGAKLLGKYDLAPGTIAYLFQRAHDQVLVSWADNPTEAEIPGAEKAQVVDLMGRAQALSGATAMIGPDPQYFTGLQGLEPTPTLSKPAFPKMETPAVDHETVLSIRFLEGTRISNRIVADLGGTEPRKAELIVTNLSARPKKIELANLSQGIVCTDLPASLTAAPGKSTSVPFSLRLAVEKTPLCYMRLSGHTGEGDISPLHVPVKPPGDALSAARAVELPAAVPGSWAPSAAALMTAQPAEEPETMRFLAHFPSSTARWVYPRFDLRSRKIDLTGSIGISFDVRLLQPTDSKLVNKAYLMLNTMKEGKQGNYQFAYRPGTDWKRIAFTWEQDAPNGFDPATVIALKIGLNPLVDDVAYEVRHVTVYYGDQPAP